MEKFIIELNKTCSVKTNDVYFNESCFILNLLCSDKVFDNEDDFYKYLRTNNIVNERPGYSVYVTYEIFMAKKYELIEAINNLIKAYNNIDWIDFKPYIEQFSSTEGDKEFNYNISHLIWSISGITYIKQHFNDEEIKQLIKYNKLINKLFAYNKDADIIITNIGSSIRRDRLSNEVTQYREKTRPTIELIRVVFEKTKNYVGLNKYVVNLNTNIGIPIDVIKLAFSKFFNESDLKKIFIFDGKFVNMEGDECQRSNTIHIKCEGKPNVEFCHPTNYPVNKICGQRGGRRTIKKSKLRRKINKKLNKSRKK